MSYKNPEPTLDDIAKEICGAMIRGDKHEEIVLCPTCKGTGYVDERVTLYDSKTVPCYDCKGDGRLLKKTAVIYERVKKVE